MKDNGPKSKRRWKGELAKPIRRKVNRPRGLAVTDDETAARANEEMEGLYQQATKEKYLTKLHLLMEHYGIADKNDFRSLALELAIDHVPGFRIDPTPLRLEKISDDGLALVVQDNNRGRRLEWTPARLGRLLDAVEDTKKKFKLSADREALSVLAGRPEWSLPANHKGDPEQWLETLESRLQDAKRSEREIGRLLKDLD